MNCPKCNGKISNTHKRCDFCGLDLTIYRKIFSLSNMYYNEALEKAQVRDLSGAILLLKKSLELNKRNTDARNLLGLIYFETGETVAALSAWVISKHFQAENNDADRYMDSIQKNPSRLETMNQTIKKYNSALQSAQSGNEDLAVIQLKKVVTLNPHFVKALQLLALLQMKNNEMEKAKRNLIRALKIDVSDTKTLLYLDAIESEQEEKEDTESEDKPVNEVRREPKQNVSFSPKISYREDKPNLRAWLNLILGAVVGLMVGYFCFVPAARKKVIQDYNNKSNSTNSEYSMQASKIDSLESDKATLEEQVKKLQDQIDNTKIPEYDEKMYDALFGTVSLYLKEIAKPQAEQDMLKIARGLDGIKPKALENASARQLYTLLKDASFEGSATALYEDGHNKYLAGKYQDALDTLLEAYKYNSKDASTIYFIGRSYQRMGENEKAKKYYDKIIKNFEDTDRYSQAKAKLSEMGY